MNIQEMLDKKGYVELQRDYYDLGEEGLVLAEDGLTLRGQCVGWESGVRLNYSGDDAAVKVAKPDGSGLYGFDLSKMFIYLRNPDATGIKLVNAHWGKASETYICGGKIGVLCDGAWSSEVEWGVFRFQKEVGLRLTGSGSSCNDFRIKRNYFDGSPVSLEINDEGNPMGVYVEHNNFGFGDKVVGINVLDRTRNLIIQKNHFEDPLGVKGTRQIVLEGKLGKAIFGTKIRDNCFITEGEAIYADHVESLRVRDNYAYGYGDKPVWIHRTANARGVSSRNTFFEGTPFTNDPPTLH